MGASIFISGLLFIAILLLIKLIIACKEDVFKKLIYGFCIFLLISAICIVWAAYHDALYQLHTGCCH